jgi:hypothetical protein
MEYPRTRPASHAVEEGKIKIPIQNNLYAMQISIKHLGQFAILCNLALFAKWEAPEFQPMRTPGNTS